MKTTTITETIETWINDLGVEELATELKRLEKDLNPHQVISVYRAYNKPSNTISYSIRYFIIEEKNLTL